MPVSIMAIRIFFFLHSSAQGGIGEILSKLLIIVLKFSVSSQKVVAYRIALDFHVYQLYVQIGCTLQSRVLRRIMRVNAVKEK